ncbi:hypothetical protein AB1Y20_023067 [Prymnesium parvum]|uniref:non-specific serine/threonine protein kinase n=1 Tax=Prymnesium parvum TaxID=97485 RepID=A0AB34JED9_PRYPA
MARDQRVGREGERGGGGGGEPHAIGTVLGQRWRLRRCVGKGTFSEIYAASDLQRERGPDGHHPQVAVKIARDSHKCSMLQHEQEILKALQGCPSVARYIELGKDAGCSYLVMTLFGENLSELRRLTPSKRFSLRTTALLGLQLLNCIHNMHELGFVHRDIKPSNCCIALAEPSKCFLCDFGLSRRWKLPNGEARPRRDHVEFRGTCRYASVHSHQHEELGRRDDLWSLFYMLLELHCGVLPWNNTRDHAQVLSLKRTFEKQMAASDPEHLCVSADHVEIPYPFVELLLHLQSLKFEEAPDYNLCTATLLKMVGHHTGLELDWSVEGIPDEKRIGARHARPAAPSTHAASSAKALLHLRGRRMHGGEWLHELQRRCHARLRLVRQLEGSALVEADAHAAVAVVECAPSLELYAEHWTGAVPLAEGGAAEPWPRGAPSALAVSAREAASGREAGHSLKAVGEKLAARGVRPEELPRRASFGSIAPLVRDVTKDGGGREGRGREGGGRDGGGGWGASHWRRERRMPEGERWDERSVDRTDRTAGRPIRAQQAAHETITATTALQSHTSQLPLQKGFTTRVVRATAYIPKPPPPLEVLSTAAAFTPDGSAASRVMEQASLSLAVTSPHTCSPPRSATHSHSGTASPSMAGSEPPAPAEKNKGRATTKDKQASQAEEVAPANKPSKESQLESIEAAAPTALVVELSAPPEDAAARADVSAKRPSKGGSSRPKGARELGNLAGDNVETSGGFLESISLASRRRRTTPEPDEVAPARPHAPREAVAAKGDVSAKRPSKGGRPPKGDTSRPKGAGELGNLADEVEPTSGGLLEIISITAPHEQTLAAPVEVDPAAAIEADVSAKRPSKGGSSRPKGARELGNLAGDNVETSGGFLESISLASRRRRTTPAPDQVARTLPHAPPEAAAAKGDVSAKRPSKRGRPPKGELGSLADEGEPTSGGDLEMISITSARAPTTAAPVEVDPALPDAPVEAAATKASCRPKGAGELGNLVDEDLATSGGLSEMISITSAQEPATAAHVEVDLALPDAHPEAAIVEADVSAKRPSKGGSSRPKGARELGNLAGDNVETSGGFLESISLASRRRRTTPAPDQVARARPHAPPEASPKKPSKRGRPPKGDSSRPKGAGALGSLADEGEPTSGGDLEIITIASAQEPTTAAPVEVDSALPDALVEAAATKADLNARRPSKGGSSRPKGTRELGSLAGDDVETSGGFLESMLLSSRRGGRQAPEYNKRQKTAA